MNFRWIRKVLSQIVNKIDEIKIIILIPNDQRIYLNNNTADEKYILAFSKLRLIKVESLFISIHF